MISVKNVSRVFKSTKKEKGPFGNLKYLFNPQIVQYTALHDVSFELKEGSFTGLIGANGAGKTTLLKILSGLIPVTSGQARVLNENPFNRTKYFRKNIALVTGQKAQLWWDLPAIDAFDLLQAIYQIPPQAFQDRLNLLADFLDVKNLLQTQMRRLSLGERMKMELIGAIIHWPKVIFLDEPTIGLDVLAAKKLRNFLKTFNHQEKITILLTSHNTNDIEELCPDVLILKEGRLIYEGQTSGLLNKETKHLRVKFYKNPSINELVHFSGLQTQEISLDESAGVFYFHLKKKDIGSVLQKLLAQFELADMGIEEAGLEEVIERLFKEHQGRKNL